MKETVLLAGGAGYIGSHTAVELIKNGYGVVIADCHYNSSPSVYERLQAITGTTLCHYDTNVCDADALERIFMENDITSVINYAGYKAVGESVREPLKYYENNLNATITLVKVMQKFDTTNLIFSSSATVYGMDHPSPLTEDMRPGMCTNPYGWTKYMSEQMLRDAATADTNLSVVLLRYFNPAGADASGLIGEEPKNIPNNLMPYIAQVAAGKRELLTIFGDDYETKDGTGVRDYIHVTDLANAHVKALEYTRCHKGTEVFNIGTGVGYSVLDMVKTFEKVNGVKVPYKIAKRRPGDVAECYADSSKAKRLLGWTPQKSLEDMCRDTWQFWQKNKGLPEGR